MKSITDKICKIKCLICDIDGVLTDGLIYLDSNGNELKTFHVQDGVGLKLLMAARIEIAVITGSYNAIIDHRMAQLGIRHYFKGQINKNQAYEALKTTLHLQDEEFAYIGDDVVDLPIMQRVGVSFAVANAVKQVKEKADWVTQKEGGRGGLREASEMILAAQNKTEEALHNYLHGTKDTHHV